MRVLITGGTGLIGKAACAHIMRAGHEVRTLARGESADWHAAIDDVAALRGAADNCDVVIHIAGIVAESPPDTTFQRINIEGTRNLLAEAERADVRRFIYVSSLGAQHGRSDYHASKRAAEDFVRASKLETVIVRPGNVYGPGDVVISTLLSFVRSLPVVPLIDEGDQPFQPVWHEDVGDVIARIALAEDVLPEYDVAGPDVVDMRALVDLIAELTQREPRKLTLPSSIVGFAARFAAAAGIEIPIKPDTLQMLLDENCMRPGANDGIKLMGVSPTPIRDGMQRLIETLPEQTIEEGVGRAQHRRISARGKSALNATQIFERFINDWHRYLVVETNVEQDNPKPLKEGDVFSIALPVRGHISVRVEEARNNAVTLGTLEGHPLAGFVRFTFADEGDEVVFEINVYDRPSNIVDAVGMVLGGSYAQLNVWTQTADRVMKSVGEDIRIDRETHALTDQELERVREWFDRLISLDREVRDRSA